MKEIKYIYQCIKCKEIFNQQDFLELMIVNAECPLCNGKLKELYSNIEIEY